MTDAGPHPRPMRRTLLRFGLVALSHAAMLLMLIAGDKIAHFRPAVPVMLLAAVPAEPPRPPPPPPPEPRQPAPKAANEGTHKAAPARRLPTPPALQDIEIAPRTDVLPTLIENAMPVLLAGGAGNAGGGAGNGNGGNGGKGGGGGSGDGGHVRVPAVIDPSSCQRPKVPGDSRHDREQRVVVLRILVDVNGRVAKTALLRPSGWQQLDETALGAPYSCQFVAGTLDGVPVPSWEYFKYTWDGR